MKTMVCEMCGIVFTRAVKRKYCSKKCSGRVRSANKSAGQVKRHGDLIGKRVNHLTIVSQNEARQLEKPGMRYWNVLCDCGNTTVLSTGQFNRATSCRDRCCRPPRTAEEKKAIRASWVASHKESVRNSQYAWVAANRDKIKERGKITSQYPNRKANKKDYEKQYHRRPQVQERLRKNARMRVEQLSDSVTRNYLGIRKDDVDESVARVLIKLKRLQVQARRLVLNKGKGTE